MECKQLVFFPNFISMKTFALALSALIALVSATRMLDQWHDRY